MLPTEAEVLVLEAGGRPLLQDFIHEVDGAAGETEVIWFQSVSWYVKHNVVPFDVTYMWYTAGIKSTPPTCGIQQGDNQHRLHVVYSRETKNTSYIHRPTYSRDKISATRENY